MSIQLKIQKEILMVLERSSELRDDLSGIFDFVSSEIKFPFVTIGEDTSKPWGSKSFGGEEVSHTIHCWSKAKGKMEVKKVMAGVKTAMISFSLEGLESYELKTSEVFDQDEIRHGVLVYQFRVKEGQSI